MRSIEAIFALQSSPLKTDIGGYEREEDRVEDGLKSASKVSESAAPLSTTTTTSLEDGKAKKVDMVARIGRVGKGATMATDKEREANGLEGFSGLLSMFKRLWRGGGTGDEK